MPLAKRVVKPVRLDRKPVPPDKSLSPAHDADSSCHRALVEVMRLLSSLVVKADEVFGDIAEECETVVNRTQRLSRKVTSVSAKVEQLNARAVKVPVSDLLNFSQITDHYKAEYGFDESVFTAPSRPDCIKDLYKDAVLSPLETIRKCNLYRTDGRTGSKIFSLPLVFRDVSPQEQPIPEIEERPIQEMRDRMYKRTIFRLHPHVETFERKHKEIREVRPRPKSLSELHELDVYVKAENVTLPTPDDKMRELSRSQPITLVPIDISGTSFDRLCEYRASIRSINKEYEETENTPGTGKRKRNRRRQTVSGIPGHVSEELNNRALKTCSDLRTRSASRERWERSWERSWERPRSMHQLDYYAPRMDKRKPRDPRKLNEDREESSLSRSCSFRRSLRSLFKGKRSQSQDLWVEGRPMSPGPPVVDLNSRPLKRSLSLPRSLKSVLRSSKSRLDSSRSASTEGRLDAVSGEEDNVDEYNHRGPPSKYGSLSRFFRRVRSKKSDSLPRSQSHHASLYTGTSTFVDGNSRAKSMEIPVHILPDNLRRAMPVAPPTVPADENTTKDNNVAGQQGRTLNIPCTDQPWARPFATVRLRSNNNKGKTVKDESQSSSGHWSGSSYSARQSVESHTHRSLSSIDKDSAVGLNLHNASGEERYPTDDPRNRNINLKDNFNKMSASDFLKNMLGKPRKRSSTIKSASSVSSEESLPTGLTQQNLKAHDYAHLPYVHPSSHNPDEESSIYSVDQEGFYTSMHKDCGVHKSNSNLPGAEQERERLGASSSGALHGLNIVCPDPRGERGSSFTGCTKSLEISESRKRQKKKAAPPPPPRSSSTMGKAASMEDTFPPPPPDHDLILADLKSKLTPPSALQGHDSSFESDAEAMYSRLKLKTDISSAVFPSLCSVTPVHSDEEDEEMFHYSNTWRLANEAQSDTLKTCKSAPGTLQESKLHRSTSSSLTGDKLDSIAELKETSPEAFRKSLDDSVVSDESEGKKKMSSCDGFSTWPRSPKCPKGSNQKLESILKIGGGGGTKNAPRPPRTLNFATAVNVFDPVSGKVTNSRQALPAAKTPDDFLDDKRTLISVTNNTFKSPDSAVAVKPMKTFQQSRSDSTSSTSLHSSSASTASSEDQPPDLPEKYQHKLTVKPRVRGAHSSGRRPGAARVSKQAPSQTEHIYANVIIEHPVPIGEPTSVAMPTIPCDSQARNLSTSFKPSASDSLAGHGHVGTWPRSRSASALRNKSSISKDTLDIPAGVDKHKEPTDNRCNSLGRGTKKFQFFSSKPVVPSSLPIKKLTAFEGGATATKVVGGVPLPAPARLVISSPVADTAQFVENPHKRSLCSPVTTQELLKFSNYNSPDKWYNALPRNKKQDLSSSSVSASSQVTEEEPPTTPSINALPKASEVFNFEPQGFDDPVLSAFKPVSQPLFPSISAMKHSIPFPAAQREEPAADGYGKTWYEGADTANNSASSSAASTPLPPKVSFNTFLKDGSHHSVPWRLRRDSNASTISTISSSSGKRNSFNFASIRKPSLSSLAQSLGSNSSGDQSSEHRFIFGAVPAEPPTVPGLKRSISNPESNLGSVFKFQGTHIKEQDATTTTTTTKRLKVVDVIKEYDTDADSGTELPEIPLPAPTVISDIIVANITMSQPPQKTVIKASNKRANSSSSNPSKVNSARVIYPVPNKKGLDQGKDNSLTASDDSKSDNNMIMNDKNSEQNMATVASASKDSTKVTTPSFRIVSSSKTVPSTTPAVSKQVTPSDIVLSVPVPKPVEQIEIADSAKHIGSQPAASIPASPTITARPTAASTASVKPPVRAKPDTSKQSPLTPVKFSLPSLRPWPPSKKISVYDSMMKNKPTVAKPTSPSAEKIPNSNNVAKTLTDSVTSKPETVRRNSMSLTAGKLKPVSETPSSVELYATLPRSEKRKAPSKAEPNQAGSKLSQVSADNLGHSSGSLHQCLNTARLSASGSSGLTKSAGNLTTLGGRLAMSNLSLAKSTDSLASNSSMSADKTRSAKLSFLDTGGSDLSASTTSLEDRFAKYSLCQKKLSASRSSLSASRTSLSTSRTNLSGPREEYSRSNSVSSDRKAVPGRFVSSKISQLHKQSMESLSTTSSPSSSSSGLGSSVPNSPTSTPNTPIAPKDIKEELASKHSTAQVSDTNSGTVVIKPVSKQPSSPSNCTKTKVPADHIKSSKPAPNQKPATLSPTRSPEVKKQDNAADFRALLKNKRDGLKAVKSNSSATCDENKNSTKCNGTATQRPKFTVPQNSVEA